MCRFNSFSTLQFRESIPAISMKTAIACETSGMMVERTFRYNSTKCLSDTKQLLPSDSFILRGTNESVCVFLTHPTPSTGNDRLSDEKEGAGMKIPFFSPFDRAHTLTLTHNRHMELGVSNGRIAGKRPAVFAFLFCNCLPASYFFFLHCLLSFPLCMCVRFALIGMMRVPGKKMSNE